MSVSVGRSAGVIDRVSGIVNGQLVGLMGYGVQIIVGEEG
jgi:hypothetical protein